MFQWRRTLLESTCTFSLSHRETLRRLICTFYIEMSCSPGFILNSRKVLGAACMQAGLEKDHWYTANIACTKAHFLDGAYKCTQKLFDACRLTNVHVMQSNEVHVIFAGLTEPVSVPEDNPFTDCLQRSRRRACCMLHLVIAGRLAGPRLGIASERQLLELPDESAECQTGTPWWLSGNFPPVTPGFISSMCHGMCFY